MPALGPSEARPIMLGRYELVAPIGRGGMAEVYLAMERGPAGHDGERPVVIKLVHEHLVSQAAFSQMLLDEARHAGMIKHPNVVEVHELGEEAGRYFIVMEYLGGEPLLEVLRLAGEGGPRLDPLSIARVIANTAEGLEAAHQLKARDGRPLELVHHDVSLGNIVVLYGGLVKLVDFGLAKAQRAPGGPRVQGKLGYTSPEKVQDAAVDRRSDLWSLGCVLWEALTLRRLFKGDSDADTVRQVLSAPIAPPSQIEPSAPPELDPIVMRALQRDPNRRYQTAKGMAADLEEVLREAQYGPANDRIAQHMEAVFAPRIAARERVLLDVSHGRRPSTEILDAAFGDAMTPAARTITSTGQRPVAPAADEEPEREESEHEASTLRTAPNAPDWRPPPGAIAGVPAAPATANAARAEQAAAAAPPAEQPAVERPAAGKPPAPPAEQPTAGKPTARKPTAPPAEQPTVGKPAAGKPPAPRAEQPAAGAAPAEQAPALGFEELVTDTAIIPVPSPSGPAVAAAALGSPAPAAPTRTRALSPSAFSQPRPRQTATTEAPKVFSVSSLLDAPGAATAPIRPDDLPPTPAAPLAPPAPASKAAPPAPPAPIPTTSAPVPEPAEPPPADASAAPADPEPPIVPPPPSMSPWGDEPNPFEDDSDDKTVADVIPANAEASRSLQAEPSWTVARQSAALGELQRWVQESRNPPKSRWHALGRKMKRWHQRVVSWTFKRRVPWWSPYAAAGVLLLLIVLLVARCAGGGSTAARGKPAAGAGSAQTMPREPGAAPAGEGEAIEMDPNAVQPPKPKQR